MARRSYHRPIVPPYYIEDCRISTYNYELDQVLYDSPSFPYFQISKLVPNEPLLSVLILHWTLLGLRLKGPVLLGVLYACFLGHFSIIRANPKSFKFH